MPLCLVTILLFFLLFFPWYSGRLRFVIVAFSGYLHSYLCQISLSWVWIYECFPCLYKKTLLSNWTSFRRIWGSMWETIPSEMCAQRDSNQPAHSRSLTSLRCPHDETLHTWLSQMRPVKIRIRLRECAGWSQSSLGAHVRRFVYRRSGPYFRKLGLHRHLRFWKYHHFLIFSVIFNVCTIVLPQETPLPQGCDKCVLFISYISFQ